MLNNSQVSSIFRSCQQTRLASFLPRAAVSTINSLVEKPKRSPNAFTIFYTEQFPIFRKQYPDFSIPEVAKRIGAKWTSLSESTKRSYSENASKGSVGDKQQYEQFKSDLTPNQALALKLIRLNNRAKRGEISRRNLTEEEQEFLARFPPAPYLTGRAIFTSSFLRKRGAGVLVTEKIGEVQSAWNALTPSERANFEEQSKKDQEEYRASMRKFLSE